MPLPGLLAATDLVTETGCPALEAVEMILFPPWPNTQQRSISHSAFVPLYSIPYLFPVVPVTPDTRQFEITELLGTWMPNAYEVDGQSTQELVSRIAELIAPAAVFAVEFCKKHQSSSAKDDTITPFLADAVHEMNLEMNGERVTVVMLLEVVIIGRVEVHDVATVSDVQKVEGGVSLFPLLSAPWKMRGFAAVGALVNDPATRADVTV